MAEEKESKKEKEKIHKQVHEKLKKSGWKIATVALLALLIMSMFTGGFKDFFFKTSKDKAAENAISYINTNLLQPGTQATMTEVRDEGSIYLVKIKVSGLDFESYITKDGKYLFPSGIDMTEKLEDVETETVTPTTGASVVDCDSAVKNDKPKVEVFVMSHCPYGTQIEKGILPVVKLLKDKIDFQLRFVYYAMHGETEVKEQLNQYCIQKEQNDKLIPYLECFLKEGDGASCLTEAKIDTAKLSACTKAADTEFKITENLNDNSKWLSGRFPLFNVDKALNDKYGIGGSPSLVINGQETKSSRDSASLLETICCAFETQPSECKQVLSSTPPSPGFGYSASGSASTGSCG